jgi:glycosyltransferase involved in cell wall biosynthesis
MSGCVVVSHPTGNANLRNVLRGLADIGLLNSYETTVACFESGLFYSLSRIPGLGEIKRRVYDSDLRPLVATQPSLELLRLASAKVGLRRLLEHETGLVCVDRIYRALDAKTAAHAKDNRIRAFYAYEDGAGRTFKAAKKAGKLCLYDLPIGYWRAAQRILQEEAERRPEWRPTMDGLDDSAAKLARKDEELLLADRILVASSFTKSTLEECPFPLAPVNVVPYGANEETTNTPGRNKSTLGSPLRVLFVGGLSQRKGIADLFDAVGLVGSQVELTVIGRKPTRRCDVLEALLIRHRWIESLPREKILAEMRAHDILVFPSLFEGFGLVVTEALSQGLPVITTSHTCGPDVLTEGEDGFIVPIRDPQAIAEKLELLHRARERLSAMSEAALKKAQMLTWSSYRQGVVNVVREALALKSA